MVINDILSVQTNHKNKSQPKFPRALNALRKKKNRKAPRPGLTSGPSEASSAEGVFWSRPKVPLLEALLSSAGDVKVSSESVSMWKGPTSS